MAKVHSHPHKAQNGNGYKPDPTRKKTPQEIAFAKIKKSPIGKDRQTAFARAAVSGGSADAAARRKAKIAGFKPSSSGTQVSKAALPKGYTQAGWARLSDRQRKLALSVAASNKRKKK